MKIWQITQSEQKNEYQPTSTVNHVTQELHNNDALKEELKNIFNHNYKYCIEKELKDRFITTRATKKVQLNILKNANEITSIHLLSIENIPF